MPHTDEYAKARRRAAHKNRFFIHVAAYAGVMGMLVVINQVTSPESLWFVWPLIGWGLALALHGMRAFLMDDRNEIVDALTERELRQSGMEEAEEGLSKKLPE